MPASPRRLSPRRPTGVCTAHGSAIRSHPGRGRRLATCCPPARSTEPVTEGPLALTVGCTFGFETPQPVSAVLQVAPSGHDLQVRAERWDTAADHHGYIDLFGNRCERVTIAAGPSRIVYEADVLLSSPSDRVAPGTPET